VQGGLGKEFFYFGKSCIIILSEIFFFGLGTVPVPCSQIGKVVNAGGGFKPVDSGGGFRDIGNTEFPRLPLAHSPNELTWKS
jgi:hypothetical protein